MKVMKKEDLKKSNLLDNVLLERNILLEARHNFIVRLKYSFQNTTFLYMVMEYIEGGDLYYYLKKEKRFKEEVARFIFAETLLAIEFLHSQRVIYRDLKPENILVCPDGHIKLADFGLSKQVRLNELTRTFAGTSEYLAPEVVKKKSYGPEVDLWELGIFLYEMLKGEPPFTDNNGRNHEKIHEQIIKGCIAFTPNFSPDSRDLIQKLLKNDPA
jgi:serine/threonine protein kinase